MQRQGRYEALDALRVTIKARTLVRTMACGAGLSVALLTSVCNQICEKLIRDEDGLRDLETKANTRSFW